MNRNQLFLSTIAADAADIARAFDLGLEIAEFCTASNLDGDFPATHQAVREKAAGIRRFTLHAPFSELFPCAIDPKARDLARMRYTQAITAAERYGAEKIVIHSGYLPQLYFDCWFEEQSILFWREFLSELPSKTVVCLENVLEPTPEPLLHVLEAVDDPRLRLCLDIGHAHVYGKEVPLTRWLDRCAPYLSHFHLHNNHGDADRHNSLFDGAIPMTAVLEQAARLAPEATYAIETEQAAASVQWLKENGILA